MSRQALLPPRCPLQKKATFSPNLGPISPTLLQENQFHSKHHRSASQSLIIDEQPAWLDELLSDSEPNACGGILHRRSASDSFTLLSEVLTLPSLNILDEAEESSPAGCDKSDEGSKSACVYGPNSPRGKGEVTFPDNAIVSALSDYVSQNALQCSDWSLPLSETAQGDSTGDASGSNGENAMEAKPVKRHPGQRSRVRKLQYIAELERTVDTLQGVRSELAANVASLLQQHTALTFENSELKQKITMLQQEKLIVDAEYHSLRKELERPKPRDKLRSSTGSMGTWQMLDFGRLNLN